MAKKIKWQIEELQYSKQLNKIAIIILHNRIDSFSSATEKYFKKKSADNLHDVRIALRRVRYSMESFLTCYNKKEFMRFYNKIQKLQDLSGSVRDIDITVANIKSLVKENSLNIENIFIEKIEEKKINTEDVFETELKKFVESKIFKSFYKQNI